MLSSFSRFYNTKSYIHSLNPLCKVLASLLFVFMTILCDSFVVLFALFIILLFIICLSNIPVCYFFRPVFGMKILFIMLFLVNLFCGVSISASVMMIGKVILIVLYSSCLVMSTTTNEIAYGFNCLLRPLGFMIPVSKISMAIALSLSFIPILFDSSVKIIKSQKSRGFNYNSGGFKDKILGIKTVFIPMFVLAMKRADNISDMMEVRNFNFDNNRRSLRGVRFSSDDVCMIGCHVVVFVFVLIKEVVM